MKDLMFYKSTVSSGVLVEDFYDAESPESAILGLKKILRSPI